MNIQIKVTIECEVNSDETLLSIEEATSAAVSAFRKKLEFSDDFRAVDRSVEFSPSAVDGELTDEDED